MTDPREWRLVRVRARLRELGVDALLLSIGADLPWLTGYEAMPLERLTALVVTDDRATLVVPELEAPRVEPAPELFEIRAWRETEDPVEIVAKLVPSGPVLLGVSDRMWASALLRLQRALPQACWEPASLVVGPIRALKDESEVAALRRAAGAADRVATALVQGQIKLVGRTEAQVSREISERLLEEGHRSVNFAIVGSGPNSASPHHDAGPRVIGRNEAVVCDFGGTLDGYCSDITRTVFTGEPPADFRDLYTMLREAQAAAVGAATAGTPCEDVDAVARRMIDGAGYGSFFIHRTGHGIGREEHEDPYIVAGNCDALAPGHAFSIEPGIYVPDRWGARIEDIVVVTELGPEALNTVDHALAIVA